MIKPSLHWLSDACQHERGGYSAMRIATLVVTVVFLLLWTGFSLYGGELIRLSWPEVTLLGAVFGGKAAQTRFELGEKGLMQPWDGEGGGL